MEHISSRTSLKWQAHEYEHHEKSSDWFWAVGIIAISMAVVAIIYADILFAILIIVGTFALCLYAARHPKLINFEVNEKGLIIDRKFYLYTTLDSFWVEEHHNFGFPSKLLVKSKKVAMPLIIVPLEGIHPDDVHDYLAQFIDEEELAEPLSQKLMEYLGF